MVDLTSEIEEAIITERKDGIIHIHIKRGMEINVDLQNKILDVYKTICRNDKKAFLFTASNYVTITKEARENSILLEALYPCIAIAVVANSTAYKLSANFYQLVNKPKSLFEIFNDKENAIEWLKTTMKVSAKRKR